MDKLIDLGLDMAKLWSNYRGMYLQGVWNTLILALVATLIGCVIGLVCGILNMIYTVLNIVDICNGTISLKTADELEKEA